MLQAAHASQTNYCEGDRTGDEDQRLHRVRVDHRRQSAGDGVDAGDDDKNYSRLPKRPAGNPLKDHARGIKLHRDFCEDVSDDRNASQINGALAVEAAFQKFRHGEDIAAQVERHEHPAQDQKDEARQPLKMSNCQP
jgi:hypothetical protein